ncbi:hypothetical protein [Microbispora bryophytorum]|uniref:hypothetical protein n=1 Tax=Microbispora bryophytorum TaxID=1460882 RepID=UPI0033D90928
MCCWGSDGPRVVDFGVARRLGATTASGGIVGTLVLTVPEGGDTVTERFVDYRCVGRSNNGRGENKATKNEPFYMIATLERT